MNIASAIAFDTAEREYNDAWNAPSSARFELPPVDVNKVLKERYRVSSEQTLTRAMIWDMETKKAWDPLTYIPYVVSQARSWGRMSLRDGSIRFCRSSLQRGWITSEEGRVLEDVFVNDAKQTIYFLGRPQMVEESGNTRSGERNRSHECDGFEAHKERAANAHGNFKSKTTLADKLVGDDVRDSGRIQSRTFFTLALE
jgi:hypothetical protein